MFLGGRKRPQKRAVPWETLFRFLLLATCSVIFHVYSRERHDENCTIVAACRVSKSNLERFKTAFLSWLDVIGVDDIVVVDWSSRVDLAQEVQHISIGSTKDINVLRINTRLPWRLALAYNQGFQLVKTKYIFKVDCDTVLHSQAYALNNLDDLVLRYANWKSAETDNEAHLNGVFLTEIVTLREVGGFDERFGLYGWEDSDLYERIALHEPSRRCSLTRGLTRGLRKTSSWCSALLNAGAGYFDVDVGRRHGTAENENLKLFKSRRCGPTLGNTGERIGDFVRILDKDDVPLLSHFPHERSSPLSLEKFGICWNRLLMKQDARPRWHISMKASCRIARYDVDDTSPMRVYRCALHEAATALHVEASKDSKKCLRSMHECVEQESPDYIPVRLCLPDHGQHSQDISPSARTVESETVVASHVAEIIGGDLRILAVEVYHGLGNRLRALASAAAIAKRFHFVLVLVWKADIHANTEIENIFSYWPASITTSANIDEISPPFRKNAKVYDFLVRKVDVDLQTHRHIYVKSPFIIDSVPTLTGHEVDDVLRSLKVSRAVQTIIDEQAVHLGDSQFLGVHVRMLWDKSKDVPGITHEANHSDKGMDAMGPSDVYRKRCHASYFIPHIQSGLAKMESTAKVYVASDSQEAIMTLVSTFGSERVLHTHVSIARDCFGEHRRETRCLQIAMAEFKLLSLSERLLISTWSSASDFVTRLSRAKSITTGCAATEGADKEVRQGLPGRLRP